MPIELSCENCGDLFSVIPARKNSARFCSLKCRGEWRSKNWRGKDHPNWQDVERVKDCEQCGKPFGPKVTITVFQEQRFCSRECGWKGQHYNSGESHPNYKPDARKRNRRGKHGSWARAVKRRDNATCQHCGVRDTELHAHHIKPFSSHPHLRWELSNGLTLCVYCHRKVHTAPDANGVNSGDILTGDAEDNPEPSFGRKPIEGVTTRGRAVRAVISSTSAPLERDDIV